MAKQQRKSFFAFLFDLFFHTPFRFLVYLFAPRRKERLSENDAKRYELLDSTKHTKIAQLPEAKKADIKDLLVDQMMMEEPIDRLIGLFVKSIVSYVGPEKAPIVTMKLYGEVLKQFVDGKENKEMKTRSIRNTLRLMNQHVLWQEGKCQKQCFTIYQQCLAQLDDITDELKDAKTHALKVDPSDKDAIKRCLDAMDRPKVRVRKIDHSASDKVKQEIKAFKEGVKNAKSVKKSTSKKHKDKRLSQRQVSRDAQLTYK